MLEVTKFEATEGFVFEAIHEIYTAGGLEQNMRKVEIFPQTLIFIYKEVPKDSQELEITIMFSGCPPVYLDTFEILHHFIASGFLKQVS